MHWPGLCAFDPTDMGPLGSPADFQPHATSWDDFKANIAGAWANMCKLKEEGLVLEVGSSNFYSHHLDELRSQCDASPYANEIFIDGTNQETEFVQQMQEQGVRVIAYRPVIYKPFPDAFAAVAEKLGASVHGVILAWMLRRGIYPIVKARGAHIGDNLSAQELQHQLTPEDMEAFQQADQGFKFSAEWFAKIWRNHNQTEAYSEDDVMMLTSLGIDEAKARECLEKCGGNVDAAMDAAFS
eukprot:TRINITY_DN24346_c0_g1_i1.p1 TRINITY_DN24346_c0_g1~~TRINITY_DN24346_c0_g1_i1.p1  ORF type:complete len:241 (+),score=59.38 TRINITY_DN24346_c0_g1_i1:246-968(+)